MEKDKNELNLDEMTNEDISKLFKVSKTLNKMMVDRGYRENENANLTFDEFSANLKKFPKMYGFFVKVDPSDSSKIFRTYYEYIPNAKINSVNINNIFAVMKDNQINSGIILLSGKLSQQAKQKVLDINTQIPIETFSLNELVVNITEHELVPKHILLSPEEKKTLLERYRIKDSQLPKIFVTDPVAKYLGLKKGEVVKIVRVSETAGRYITYRIAC